MPCVLHGVPMLLPRQLKDLNFFRFLRLQKELSRFAIRMHDQLAVILLHN